MPCVSGMWDRRGLKIQVGFVDSATREKVEGRAEADPTTACHMPGANVLGIIDTGATSTAISERVVEQLGIPPIGKVRLKTAAGTKEANTYQVDVILFFGSQVIPLTSMTVTEFEAGSEDGEPQALIGLDVLQKGSLSMDFTGHYTFCV